MRAHPGSNPAVVVRDTGLTNRDTNINDLIRQQQEGTTRLYPPAAGTPKKNKQQKLDKIK